MANPPPIFTRPPVVETVLGVHFLPIEHFEAPYFGLYWEKIRKRYPSIEIKPPVTEGPPIQIRMEMVPLLRCWYIDSSRSRLLQVQRDRFYYNWRKTADEVQYPHYNEDLRQHFVDEWIGFTDFIEAEKLGDCSPQICEITYINHIPRGQGWREFSDLPNIFAFLSQGIESRVLSKPTGLSFSGVYALPDGLGQLQVQFQPALRQEDNVEVLQLVLVARGQPSASKTEGLLAWFDSAQPYMVEAFAEFTSGPMHEVWERRKRT